VAAAVNRLSALGCAATIAAVVAVCTPVQSRALGALEHPSIEESASGVRGILCGAFPLYGGPASHRPTARWALEASENLLYGIAGLHVTGARAGVRVGPSAFVGEAAQLASDVGRETRLAFTPAIFVEGRWAASVAVVYESAFIDGFAPTHSVSVTGRSLVRLTQALSLGGEIDRYGVYGEHGDGADVSIGLLVRPVAGAVLRGIVDFERLSGAQPCLSATVSLTSALRLSFGYESASDALKGALAVGFGGVTCAAGVDYHPVLGARQGLALSWCR